MLFYESVDEALNDTVHDISQGLSDMSVNSSNSESFCVPQVGQKCSKPLNQKSNLDRQKARAASDAHSYKTRSGKIECFQTTSANDVQPRIYRLSHEHCRAQQTSIRNLLSNISLKFSWFLFSVESAREIRLESFSIEDRLSDSGTVATKYDKWIVDELLSLSASFLTNIGFWLSRQPRKIMVGLSSEHANWHGLGSG